MNAEMRKKEFAEQVCQHVKDALPEELAEADVRIAMLDLWADSPHTVLLAIRPWGGITTGFCLDRHYQKETIEAAAASILNDRRLYVIPNDKSLELEGGAVIYA